MKGWLLATVALLAWTAPVAYAEHHDVGLVPEMIRLVVPGHIMGNFGLDWSIARFRSKLGSEKSVRDIRRPTLDGKGRFPAQLHYWADTGLLVFSRPDKNDRVIAINIYISKNPASMDTNIRYRTIGGLGLLSFRKDIEALLGRPDWSWTEGSENYISYSTGIIFAFPKRKPDRATMVGVWLPELWR